MKILELSIRLLGLPLVKEIKQHIRKQKGEDKLTSFFNIIFCGSFEMQWLSETLHIKTFKNCTINTVNRKMALCDLIVMVLGLH